MRERVKRRVCEERREVVRRAGEEDRDRSVDGRSGMERWR